MLHRSALAICLDAIFGLTQKDSLQAFLQRYPSALDLMVAARQHGRYTPEMITQHLGATFAAVPDADQSQELFCLVEFLTMTTQMLGLTPLPMMGGVVAAPAVTAPAVTTTPTGDWPPANVREGSKTHEVLVALGPAAHVRSLLQQHGGSIGALRKLLKKQYSLKLSDPYFRSLLLKHYGLKATTMEGFLGASPSQPAPPSAVKPKRKYTRRAKAKAEKPDGGAKNVSQMVRLLFAPDELIGKLKTQGSVSGLADYINRLPDVKKAGFSLTDANCSMLIKSMTGKRASDILGNRRLPKQRR